MSVYSSGYQLLFLGYGVTTASTSLPSSPLEIAACFLGVACRGASLHAKVGWAVVFYEIASTAFLALGAMFGTKGALAPKVMLVLNTTTGNAAMKGVGFTKTPLRGTLFGDMDFQPCAAIREGCGGSPNPCHARCRA